MVHQLLTLLGQGETMCDQTTKQDLDDEISIVHI